MAIDVVAAAFEGKNAVNRQRMVRAGVITPLLLRRRVHLPCCAALPAPHT